MSYEHLLHLSLKTVRNFNHYLFMSICIELNVVPKGLSLKKNPCVGKFTSNALRRWNNVLNEGGKSLVEILCDEYQEKWKCTESEFWNVMVKYLESSKSEIVSKHLEGLLRNINCLMSELKLKRCRKLKKLIASNINLETLELSKLESFSFISDIVYVKASFKSNNISTRRKRNLRLRSENNSVEVRDEVSPENVIEQNDTVNVGSNMAVENGEEIVVDNESSNMNGSFVVNENDHLARENSNERLCGKFVSSNVLNLSNKVLTEAEISVLSKGLGFSPTPKELDRSQLKQDLEEYGRRLRLKWFYRESEDFEIRPRVFKVPSKFNPKNVDAAIEIYLSTLEEKLMNIKSEGSNYSNLSAVEQEALRSLRSDKSIVIKPADKGSGVVVWDREDYLREAERQLSDSEVYEKCESDPLPALQTKISKLLKNIKGKKEIDDKTLNYLMVNNPRLGRFYLLPKIHKRLHSVPGRPVISNCGYLTERISSFLDFHLQPISKTVKSYIKDTNDFICKLKNLPSLPEDAILCTVDVVGLYPSIPHDQGLEAMRKALDSRVDKSVSTESLVHLAELVLKNNYFEHNSQTFHQKQGTAIGTKFAPTYAILSMGDLEETALENYRLKPWVWWRYIDDIFLVWEHGEESLLEFLRYLNSIHPTIKFTHKYSRDCIEFLDVLVAREGDKIETDLFVKETDTHQFLHFSSCHPFHTKKGIPYSQALRMRRICSTNESFSKRTSDLKDWLYARGYEKTLVDSQVDRASSLNREQILAGNSGRDSLQGREVFSVTFHPACSKKIYDILREVHVIFQGDEEHKNLFPSVPLVSFRRAKTLQDRR